MPDYYMLFWYGWLRSGFVGLATAGATHTASNVSMQNPTTITTKAYCIGSDGGSTIVQGLMSNNPMDITDYTKFVGVMANVGSDTVYPYKARLDLSTVKTNMYASGTYYGDSVCDSASPQKCELDISSQSGNKYVYVASRPIASNAVDIYAAWLQ